MFIRSLQFSSSIQKQPSAEQHSYVNARTLNDAQDTKLGDTFVKADIGVQALPAFRESDELFKKLGLTCAVATADDMPEIIDSVLNGKKNGDGLSGETEKAWYKKHIEYYKRWATQTNLYPDTKLRENVFKLFENAIENVDKLDEKTKKTALVQDYKKRYIDMPKSIMLILRDKNNKLVARMGLNPFQAAHDLISFGIKDIIDEKHGIVGALGVESEYRNKGIGMALKKKMIVTARELYGYQYLHSPTETHNSSHRINQKLGYTQWTPETQFKETPSITSTLVKEILDTYNVGPCQLCWIYTRTIK